MTNQLDSNRFWGLPTTLVLGLYLCAILYISEFRVLGYFGAACALLNVLLCVLYVFVNARSIKVSVLWMIFFLFAGYVSLGLIINYTGNGLYIWAQQLVLMLYGTILATLPISEKSFMVMKTAFSRVYICFLILSTAFIALGRGTFLLHLFSGTVFKVFFALSFFALIGAKSRLVIVVYSCVVFLLLGERTAVIVMALIYLLDNLLCVVRRHKTQYIGLYWAIVVPAILFPKFYVWLSTQHIAPLLNELSWKYLNGRFFSGRNVIWSIALDALKGRELFGVGIGNSVLKDAQITLSTHNLYIYLMLQGGNILLILFVLFMFVIWVRYYVNIDNEIVRTSAAFFIGILVFLDFELFLLINNFVVSMYFWLIIGIGLMIGNDKSRRQTGAQLTYSKSSVARC